MKMEIENSLDKAFGLAAAVLAGCFAFDFVEENYDYLHAKFSGFTKKKIDEGLFAKVTKKEGAGAEDITD